MLCFLIGFKLMQLLEIPHFLEEVKQKLSIMLILLIRKNYIKSTQNHRSKVVLISVVIGLEKLMNRVQKESD